MILTLDNEIMDDQKLVKDYKLEGKWVKYKAESKISNKY